MDLFAQYGLFALKTITLVIAFLIVFVSSLSLGRRPKPMIHIESLNDAYAAEKKRLQKLVPLDKTSKKNKTEKSKKISKAEKKKAKAKLPSRFVLSFEGDVEGSQVAQLRDEISMILSLATPKDEVVLRVESPGGEVSAYGLAASQLQRLRDKKIPLTICIDKVAASGGYLMACVANQILAAPFAIIGSIGVVAQIPNFHRLLKKNNIDIELLTAGKYKRTLTMLGENTKEGREKFKEDLEAVQALFRNHVFDYRNQIDIDRVSTGEHWLAKDAVDLGLIDVLKTSDDYLYDDIDKFNTLVFNTPVKKTLTSKLMKPLSALFHHSGYRL
ncbi:MAG: protease SohB [Gammaproteobacteria bacterium]|nr:protease SohB [Gammaproteobacteria bacterium]